MAAHGYMVFLVRSHPKGRPRELTPLDSIGESGEDLAELLHVSLRHLGEDYHAEEKTSEGFRLKELQPKDFDKNRRDLWVKINKGPQGAAGEAYHLDTGDTIETTERQALLSGLRAYFMIPKNSVFGLLFVERVGRRHLRNVLLEKAVTPSSIAADCIVRLEGFAESADWRRELSGKKAIRVTEVLHRTSSADDQTTMDDAIIRVTTEGAAVSAAGGAILDLVERRAAEREGSLRLARLLAPLLRAKRAAKEHHKVSFTAEDANELKELEEALDAARAGVADKDLASALGELIPVDRESVEHRRFDVAVGEERVERTFSVERDSIPQFVYETKPGLPDAVLKKAWAAHAERIFKLLN